MYSLPIFFPLKCSTCELQPCGHRWLINFHQRIEFHHVNSKWLIALLMNIP